MKRKSRNERYTAPLGNPRHFSPFVTFVKKAPAKPLAEETEEADAAPAPAQAKAEGPRPIPKCEADADALDFGALVRFYKAVLKT